MAGEDRGGSGGSVSSREGLALRRASPWPMPSVLGPGVAIALLVGASLSSLLADLPPNGIALALAVVSAGVWCWVPRGRWIAALLFGLTWACVHGGWALQQRIAPELEGRDLDVRGRVIGLPQFYPRLQRFDFEVEAGEGEAAVLAGRRLRLGWYGEAPKLAPGSRWQLQLRLKRPRGVINPGGFDFERHALERRLAATGYVREQPGNRELEAGGGIDALRERLSQAIGWAVGSVRARFVQALALGDTRGLDENDWETLRATGIAHLIAISGFHVGLVAGFGALLLRLAYRLVPALALRIPLPQSAAFSALLFAGGYTALAGFALPTLRTWLMIAAVLLQVLFRRRLDAWQSVAWAAIVIVLVDPLSVLSAGFWLSFLGVVWLIWCLPHEPATRPVRALFTAQGVMSLSLLPLTVWFFGQASLVGPVANLIAVPWVSLVVVPLALIGTGLSLIFEPLGAPWFIASGWAMQALWTPLELASQWRGALIYLPAPDAIAFVLATLGAFWLLLPRAVPGKWLASLLFLPLLWPARDRPASGEADIWLLDVGQGLSLLVRTKDHALVYDAGPAYAGGLDLGEAAVVPALRALGVSRLDAYVESHGDNDHAGGSDALLRAFAPSRVYASDPTRASAIRCESGDDWEWDGVRFQLLHPPPHFPYLKNDSSCVLRIETAGASALLPGDISDVIESRLLREQSDRLKSDLLIVPHHGSRSSSTTAFLGAVDPELALIGVGHRNRFDLPRPDVLQRYADAGIEVLDTADAGAIRLRLGPPGVTSVASSRETGRRYWQEE